MSTLLGHRKIFSFMDTEPIGVYIMLNIVLTQTALKYTDANCEEEVRHKLSRVRTALHKLLLS